MNQDGALEFFRAWFYGFAIFAFAELMTAAVRGGDWGSTGIALVFVLSSYPTGAFGFLLASQDFLDTVANPYARAFVSWAPFFVLGWIQWAVLFPVLRLLVQRIREKKRAV